MQWFRVASHLSRTVDEAQDTITSTGFLKWIWFLDWKEWRQQRREDYYQAQISASVVKGWAENPDRVTPEKMLMTFVPELEKKPMSKEMRLQNSQNYWKGVAGVGKKKVKTRKPPIKGSE